MKRYFDFPDSRVTLCVEVKAGSAAAPSSPERIRDYFKQKGVIREINRDEYKRLTAVYTEAAGGREGRGGMKSKDRVPAGYREGTRDWDDQYNMLLDDGITCNECVHMERCCALFGQKPYINSGRCQFYPNRFKAAQAGEGGQ